MEKDISWKEYFRDDERYADVINGIGFGGRQLVVGENLEEADTQTIFGGWYGGSLGTSIRGRRKQMRRIREADGKDTQDIAQTERPKGRRIFVWFWEGQ